MMDLPAIDYLRIEKVAVLHKNMYEVRAVPSSTAHTMVQKLSSAKIMSAAWRVMSVPERPIATPTSA